MATLTVHLEVESDSTKSIFQRKNSSEVWYPLFSTYFKKTTVTFCSTGLRVKVRCKICSARFQATENPANPMMTANQEMGKFCNREIV